jgi:hypothetical protein
MRKKLLFATLTLAILLVPASIVLAANDYTTTAATTPAVKGTASKHVPVGAKLSFSVLDTDGKRPKSMEKLAITLPGIATNGARFKACSAAKITQASSDASCPRGSLIGTGFARNVAGSRTNFDDQSIRCYLTLRLHNAGAGKLALFVKGDPNAAGDKNCPVQIATAIPISIAKANGGSVMRLSIPESLKHPISTLTNSIVEMNLTVARKTARYKGKTVGMLEAAGRCSRGARTVVYAFSNEGGESARETARARC